MSDAVEYSNLSKPKMPGVQGLSPAQFLVLIAAMFPVVLIMMFVGMWAGIAWLVLALVFVLGTFGMNFQITMALMATEEFGKGAGEFGLLGSVMAIGSLSAALLSARRERPRMRVLLLSLAAFVGASGLAALAPTYPLFALSLVPVGLSALTAMTTANAMVQLRSDAAVRGRVMALYTAVFFGGTPIGAPVVGWIGEVPLDVDPRAEAQGVAGGHCARQCAEGARPFSLLLRLLFTCRRPRPTSCRICVLHYPTIPTASRKNRNSFRSRIQALNRSRVI